MNKSKIIKNINQHGSFENKQIKEASIKITDVSFDESSYVKQDRSFMFGDSAFIYDDDDIETNKKGSPEYIKHFNIIKKLYNGKSFNQIINKQTLKDFSDWILKINSVLTSLGYHNIRFGKGWSTPIKFFNFC